MLILFLHCYFEIYLGEIIACEEENYKCNIKPSKKQKIQEEPKNQGLLSSRRVNRFRRGFTCYQRPKDAY